MLIKTFCEATGLSRDTVRFYVKRGLLTPDIGSRPGNRYLVFDAAQVERARIVRTARALGFKLKEIADLSKVYSDAAITRDGKVALLRSRLSALEKQQHLLGMMKAYFSAKIRWIEEGEQGTAPRLLDTLIISPRTRRARGVRSGGSKVDVSGS